MIIANPAKILLWNIFIVYFHCTYHVDQAMKLKSLSNGLEIPKKATIIRGKLVIQKCENFLDFLFNNEFLQDVASGVTNLKFDLGIAKKLHKLVTKYSHTISFYLEACKNSDYNPLSKKFFVKDSGTNKTIKEEPFRWLW